MFTTELSGGGRGFSFTLRRNQTSCFTPALSLYAKLRAPAAGSSLIFTIQIYRLALILSSNPLQGPEYFPEMSKLLLRDPPGICGSERRRPTLRPPATSDPERKRDPAALAPRASPAGQEE